MHGYHYTTCFIADESAGFSGVWEFEFFAGGISGVLVGRLAAEIPIKAGKVGSIGFGQVQLVFNSWVGGQKCLGPFHRNLVGPTGHATICGPEDKDGPSLGETSFSIAATRTLDD